MGRAYNKGAKMNENISNMIINECDKEESEKIIKKFKTWMKRQKGYMPNNIYETIAIYCLEKEVRKSKTFGYKYSYQIKIGQRK